MPKSLLLPILLSLAAPAAAGCGGSGTHATRRIPAPPVEYRLGAEDLVEVNVWKEPGLSTTAPVRPDGKLTVPAIGELRAEGRTTHELEREITTRLASLVTSPIVSVIVKEVRASRVYVLGEVQKPGVFPLNGRLNVLEAIALAGGLTEFADRDDIVVLRRLPDGNEERLGFDYGSASARGGAFALSPGDTVVVK